MRKPPVTRSDVVAVLGIHDDAKIADIIATGATVEDLVEAFEWASGGSDVMADARRSLSGVVARIYDILVSDEEFLDERR